MEYEVLVLVLTGKISVSDVSIARALAHVLYMFMQDTLWLKLHKIIL